MKMQAIWNGEVIAESDSTVWIEGNHYFPVSSINAEYFEPSEHTSSCFWKGIASYYDLVVGDKRNPTAAWYYQDPSAAASSINDHVAFWRGVEVRPKG